MDRLCQDRNFIDKVAARYRSLRQSTLSDEHIHRLLASYQDELGGAIERNFKVWAFSFSENLLTGTANGRSRDIRSYEEAVTQLAGTIEKRLAYLDDNIELLYEYCED